MDEEACSLLQSQVGRHGLIIEFMDPGSQPPCRRSATFLPEVREWDPQLSAATDKVMTD